MLRPGFAVLLVSVVCSSCGGSNAPAGDTSVSGAGRAGDDSAFRALQQRGKAAMGVDQYASAHVFDPLPDGGRIVLQMKAPDSIGESVIRDHMRDIAQAFGRGDFAIPGRVHAMSNVPGTAVMSRLHGEIFYTPGNLERGGEVRITTGNPEGVAAIHEFLAFQRKDHRAGKH